MEVKGTNSWWLREWEKERADKLAILRYQVQEKKRCAFDECIFGNLKHQLEQQAMVNAYDVVLNLINEALK